MQLDFASRWNMISEMKRNVESLRESGPTSPTEGYIYTHARPK
jgi:hypothetical protein